MDKLRILPWKEAVRRLQAAAGERGAARARRSISFIGFCASLVILFDGYWHFPTLDSFLGPLLLVAWVLLGIMALLRAYASSDSPTMLRFLGALPQRWRKRGKPPAQQ
jgi:hypothetical protein